MKFKVGDKVKEIHPPYEEGQIVEANKDRESSTGEFYLIDFGEKGNQWSNGQNFVIVETDFL